jgi:hypothetical protein
MNEDYHVSPSNQDNLIGTSTPSPDGTCLLISSSAAGRVEGIAEKEGTALALIEGRSLIVIEGFFCRKRADVQCGGGGAHQRRLGYKVLGSGIGAKKGGQWRAI